MTKAEEEFIETLKQIRDSKYRTAASLRGLAETVLYEYYSGDFSESKN